MVDQKQKIENNKLFAEFLGMRLQDYHGELGVFEPMNRVYTRVKRLKFRTDWNMLMRVVKVIENREDEYGSYLKFHIGRTSAQILDSLDYTLAEAKAGSKKEAVYQAALEFIKNRKND